MNKTQHYKNTIGLIERILGKIYRTSSKAWGGLGRTETRVALGTKQVSLLGAAIG